MKKNILKNACLFIVFWSALIGSTYSQRVEEEHLEAIDLVVKKMMSEGHIPGMSVMIFDGGKKEIINYGYANVEKQESVTNQTHFELASCSKAFTALATLKLVKEGKIHLDSALRLYVPWLKLNYNEVPRQVTVRQLLQHTSGIPWQSISLIPVSDEEDALKLTIEQLNGIALSNLPGAKFEYATINYDVLAYIIEQVTQSSFESYMEQFFQELTLNDTHIGKSNDYSNMAVGYKDGFFGARAYEAPVYKGNNGAGYIVSTPEDLTKWMEIQLGMMDTDLDSMIEISHQRDRSVNIHNSSSYGMGWHVSLRGNGAIYHDGLNPNFTSHVLLRPEDKIGVAVLANSNTGYTSLIANSVMQILNDEEAITSYNISDNNDKTYSLISVMLILYILIVVGFLGYVIFNIVKGRRVLDLNVLPKIKAVVLSVLVLAPFAWAIYKLPSAMSGFTWESVIVWFPTSFLFLINVLLIAVSITYLAYVISLFYPETNKYKKHAPQILLMSTLSGLSNMVVIILVTSSIGGTMSVKYQMLYFGLTLFVYLLGRRYVQIQLIKLTRDLIFELKINLIEKIFSSSYQKLEQVDRGRIYTALNDDVGTIGQSTNMFVMLVTNTFTAVGAFIFLAAIAFWATIVTIFLVSCLAITYHFVSKSTNKYFEEARDTRNVYMRLINGMMDGFMEISLQRNKKIEYKKDIELTADAYRVKTSTAQIRFTNAFLMGESLLIVLLGIICFIVPILFPAIQTQTLLSFIIVLLYLINPVSGILSALPVILQVKIAWNRIKQFLKDVPANIDLNEEPNVSTENIESIRTEGINFCYRNEDGQKKFTVGPINLEVKRGEILFIIGGNGCGKTTLAKLLTGLYQADEGEIMINNKVVNSAVLGEYYSTVFSGFHLFDKMYNVNDERRVEKADEYLKMLDLDKKVELIGNKYSTIDLSGGQRKRLALLQCFLEDSPIYLFDEWAADQDPSYRHFFYRVLLPEMKANGKIIIAITHDDHYFDVADKVLKMDQGKLDLYTDNYANPCEELVEQGEL